MARGNLLKYLVDDAVDAAKKTKNYVSKSSNWGQHGHDPINTALDAANFVGNASADAVIWGAKKMVKDTTPGVANLWTGKRESGVGIAAAAVGVGAYSVWQGMKQTTLAPKVGQVSYSGAPPAMNADGVSSTPQAPVSNAPTLGASGQMVFGLHNARKG